MISFQEVIEKRLFGKKQKSGLEVFHEVCFVLAKEFGWTFEEIVESPMPFILSIISQLQEAKKAEASAHKKKGHR